MGDKHVPKNTLSEHLEEKETQSVSGKLRRAYDTTFSKLVRKKDKKGKALVDGSVPDPNETLSEHDVATIELARATAVKAAIEFAEQNNMTLPGSLQGSSKKNYRYTQAKHYKGLLADHRVAARGRIVISTDRIRLRLKDQKDILMMFEGYLLTQENKEEFLVPCANGSMKALNEWFELMPSALASALFKICSDLKPPYPVFNPIMPLSGLESTFPAIAETMQDTADEIKITMEKSQSSLQELTDTLKQLLTEGPANLLKKISEFKLFKHGRAVGIIGALSFCLYQLLKPNPNWKLMSGVFVTALSVISRDYALSVAQPLIRFFKWIYGKVRKNKQQHPDLADLLVDSDEEGSLHAAGASESEDESLQTPASPKTKNRLKSGFDAIVNLAKGIFDLQAFDFSKTNMKKNFNEFASVARSIASIERLIHLVFSVFSWILEKIRPQGGESQFKAFMRSGTIRRIDNWMRVGCCYFNNNGMKHAETRWQDWPLLNKLKNDGDEFLRAITPLKDFGPFGENFVARFTLVYTMVKSLYEAGLKLYNSPQQRVSPFCVYVYGPPGNGKSELINLIAEDLMAIFGMPFDKKKHMYTRTPGREFFDGYKHQFVFVLDDLVSVKDPAARVLAIQEIIQYMNTAEFSLNMASLQDKGMYSFNSPFVIITSNAEPDPEAQWLQYAENPLAITRRFNYVIEVNTKNEYMIDPTVANGQRFDALKADVKGQFNPNCMRYNVTHDQKVTAFESSKSYKIMAAHMRQAGEAWINRQKDINRDICEGNGHDLRNRVPARISADTVDIEDAHIVYKGSDVSDNKAIVDSLRAVFENRNLKKEQMDFNYISERVMKVYEPELLDEDMTDDPLADAAATLTPGERMKLRAILNPTLVEDDWHVFMPDYIAYALYKGYDEQTYNETRGMMYLIYSSLKDNCKRVWKFFSEGVQKLVTKMLPLRWLWHWWNEVIEMRGFVQIFIIAGISGIGVLVRKLYDYFTKTSDLPEDSSDEDEHHMMQSGDSKTKKLVKKKVTSKVQSVINRVTGNLHQAISDNVRDIGKIIREQTVILVLAENSENPLQGFFIDRKHILVNKHCIANWSGHPSSKIVILLPPRFEGFVAQEDLSALMLDRKEILIKEDQNTDFAILEITGDYFSTSHVKSIIHLFVSDEDWKQNAPKNVVVSGLSEVANPNFRDGYAISVGEVILEKKNLSITDNRTKYVANYDYLLGANYGSWKGFCGASVQSNDPGFKLGSIIGINGGSFNVTLSGGKQKSAIIVSTPRDRIVALMNSIPEENEADSTELVGSLDGWREQYGPKGEFVPLENCPKFSADKNTPLGTDETALKILGTMGGMHRISTKSTIVKSPLHGLVYPSVTAPSMMKGISLETNPMRKGVMACAVEPVVLDQGIVDFIGRDMLNTLCSYDSVYNNMQYTWAEAINGKPGTNMHAISMTSSPGFPFVLESTQRKSFFNGFDGHYLPTVDLQREIDDLWKELDQGVPQNVYVQDHLKDERRPLEKVNDYKTRIFNAMGLHVNIVGRKLFSEFISHIMANCIEGECSVGINVHSNEWRNLCYRLSRFGGRTMIAGDYSAFDKTLPRQLVDKFFEVVCHWYDSRGMNAEDNERRHNFGQMIAAAKHICGGVVYQVQFGNPSGNVLTVILNSIVNSMIIRYAYYVLYSRLTEFERNTLDGEGEFWETFHQNVEIATYGDDNVIAVDPRCYWFNQKSISEVLAEVGLKYTSTDKKEFETLFTQMKDVSYLKRKFVWEGSFCKAPLEFSSLTEQINWQRKAPNAFEAFRQNWSSFNREMAHYDLDTWIYHTEKITAVANEYQIYLPVFRWQELRNIWRLGPSSIVRPIVRTPTLEVEKRDTLVEESISKLQEGCQEVVSWFMDVPNWKWDLYCEFMCDRKFAFPHEMPWKRIIWQHVKDNCGDLCIIPDVNCPDGIPWIVRHVVREKVVAEIRRLAIPSGDITTSGQNLIISGGSRSERTAARGKVGQQQRQRNARQYEVIVPERGSQWTVGMYLRHVNITEEYEDFELHSFYVEGVDSSGKGVKSVTDILESIARTNFNGFSAMTGALASMQSPSYERLLQVVEVMSKAIIQGMTEQATQLTEISSHLKDISKEGSLIKIDTANLIDNSNTNIAMLQSILNDLPKAGPNNPDVASILEILKAISFSFNESRDSKLSKYVLMSGCQLTTYDDDSGKPYRATVDAYSLNVLDAGGLRVPVSGFATAPAKWVDPKKIEGDLHSDFPDADSPVVNETSEQVITFITSDPPSDATSPEMNVSNSYEKQVYRSEIQDFFSREYLVLAKTISSSTAKDTLIFDIDPLMQFIAQRQIRNKLDGYQYLRGDVIVRIETNATKFHSGALQISWIPPNRVHWVQSGNATMSELTGYNGGVMTLTGNDNFTMTMPFINTVQAWDLSKFVSGLGGAHTLGALNCFTLTKVNVAATVSSIYVRVYLSMRNVEYFGYVADQLLKFEPPPAPLPYSLQTEAQAQFASFDKVSLYHNKVGSLDGSDPEQMQKSIKKVTTGVAEIVKSVVKAYGEQLVPGSSALMSTLGFHKPSDVSSNQATNLKWADLAMSRGLDTGKKIGIGMDNTVGPFLDLGPFSMNEMEISNIVRTPMMLCRRTLKGDAPAGTQILAWLPAPHNVGASQILDSGVIQGGDTVSQLAIDENYLSHVASCAEFWRGSLRITMRVICTGFHSFRLRAFWIPGDYMNLIESWTASTIPSLINVSSTINTVIDVNGAATHTFEIPFQREDFLLPGRMKSSAKYSDTIVNNEAYNGLFVVETQTPLAYPSDPAPDVEFVFYVSSNQMQLFRPTTTDLSSVRNAGMAVHQVVLSDPTAKVTRVVPWRNVTDSAPALEFQGQLDGYSREELKNDNSNCFINSTTQKVNPQTFFGENINHVKDFICRPGPILTARMSRDAIDYAKVNEKTAKLSLVLPNIVVSPWYLSGQVMNSRTLARMGAPGTLKSDTGRHYITSWYTGSASADQGVSMTYLQWFMEIFAMSRGDFCVKIINLGTDLVKQNEQNGFLIANFSLPRDNALSSLRVSGFGNVDGTVPNMFTGAKDPHQHPTDEEWYYPQINPIYQNAIATGPIDLGTLLGNGAMYRPGNSGMIATEATIPYYHHQAFIWNLDLQLPVKLIVGEPPETTKSQHLLHVPAVDPSEVNSVPGALIRPYGRDGDHYTVLMSAGDDFQFGFLIPPKRRMYNHYYDLISLGECAVD